MKEEKLSKAELPKNVLLKAIRTAARHAKTIHFSGGGEPLLHPDIIEALKLAKKLGLKIALSTNGVYLTQEIFDLIDFPRISLNASSNDNYEQVCGADLFDRVTKNIQKLKGREKLGLAYVLVPENSKGVYQFLKLAEQLKVGFVHIRPAYLKDDRDLRNCLPDVEQQVKAFKGSVEVYFKIDKFDGYWTPRIYDKCRATPLLAVLKANGKFIPCQDRLDLEFGNFKKQSFEEIWFSEEHQEVINAIKLEECPRCVETKKNEYIQKIFIEDAFKKDIL